MPAELREVGRFRQQCAQRGTARALAHRRRLSQRRRVNDGHIPRSTTPGTRRTRRAGARMASQRRIALAVRALRPGHLGARAR